MKTTKKTIVFSLAITFVIAYWTNSGVSAENEDVPFASSAFFVSAKVTASDPAPNAFFGGAVAVNGDIAIIGAYNDVTPAGAGAGSCYSFVRNGNVWTQQQKLVASDGAANDNFGVSVALSGDTLVVGADRDDVSAGSVYVYTRSGNTWTFQQKLTASDRSSFDIFGHSVAISGDTIVVGAFNDSIPNVSSSGSAYVFTRSLGVWTQQQKLTALDAGIQDNFGFSVGINGDTVVAGSYQDDSATAQDAGSAYVFIRSGNVWTQQQKLTASDAAEGDFFGESVAISGNTVVVGAFFDDTVRGDSAGSAYVYTRTGTLWTEQQHLTASDGAAIDDFGHSVAISGNTILVGATGGNTPEGVNSGTAYVYTRSGIQWTEQQELVASDGSAPEDFFGSSVALSGNTAIIGEFFDDLNAGENAGSAYIFTTPSVTVSGRVSTPSGASLRNATVNMVDSLNVRRTATTSSFGIYSFDNVIVGETYTVSVASKRFRFAPQILQFNNSVSNLDFIGLE